MRYKVLIGTWGKPDQWKETIYKFNHISNTSKTSLLTLKEAINPDKIVIIALDTICDIVDAHDSSLSYSDIKKACEEIIREFCRENIGYEPEKIIIAPGSGSFSKMAFFGNMQDYFYIIFEQLAGIFIEIIKSVFYSKNGHQYNRKVVCENSNSDEEDGPKNYPASNEIMEIHLDLTHGINFMPTLTYRALKELISMLEVLLKVEFSVYNSEPYIPNKELEIHMIERSLKLRPLFPLEFIENQIILLECYRHDEASCEEKKEIRALSGGHEVGEINTFFGSLLYGLILALIALFPDSEQLRHTISTALDYFHSKIIVKCGPLISVIRKVSLTEHFGTLLKAWFLSSCLSMAGVQRKDEVSLSELKKINGVVFKKFPLLRNLIDNEIYSIDDKLSGKSLPDWKLLMMSEKDKPGSPDFRNFMAHAGIEKNLTLVKKVNGELRLKYDPDRVDNVKRFARKALELKQN